MLVTIFFFTNKYEASDVWVGGAGWGGGGHHSKISFLNQNWEGKNYKSRKFFEACVCPFVFTQDENHQKFVGAKSQQKEHKNSSLFPMTKYFSHSLNYLFNRQALIPEPGAPRPFSRQKVKAMKWEKSLIRLGWNIIWCNLISIDIVSAD